MARSAAVRASLVGIAANSLLLAIKAAATSLSDSLTIFSETLNSLADVVASCAILLCVRWAWTSPDETHPYGHRRAEPIAGLLVSIFAGILAFEVCRTAVLRWWTGQVPTRIGPWPITALCFTGALKAWLALYFWRTGRTLNSPALRATALDCRNDVIIAAQGLVGVVIAEFRLPSLDFVTALVVGGYIFYSAIRLGMENIDYLMGKAPDAAMIGDIRAAAEQVGGVEAVRSIKGHYVGTFVHVELTAHVDGSTSTEESHEISEAVRARVESVTGVDRAFVHIEPTEQQEPPAPRRAGAAGRGAGPGNEETA